MRIDKYKDRPKGYYHLSTDGMWGGIIFHTPELFAYGMTLMGLITLRFPLRMYDFILMENHIHMLLSGTGLACTEAFHYIVRKMNLRLRKAGFPPLPEDYGFKLVPVEDKEQLAKVFVYIDRNTHEKQLCVPGGYPWGAAMLHHSLWGSMIKGVRADALSKRDLIRFTGSRISIPGNWEFHPVLGLLPRCFIHNKKFLELFPTPKEYDARLVKEYEAFVHVADSVGEIIEFSNEEAYSIVNNLLRGCFEARKVAQLNNEEKGRLVVMLGNNYHLESQQIATVLHLQEYLVKQILNAKDFGKWK